MGKTKGNKCKCCGSTISGDFQLIYDDEGKRLNVEFLLFDYVGKKVRESDGGNQAICSDCLKQLVQCYEFKKKCNEAGNDSTSTEGESESEEAENKPEDQGFDNDQAVETNCLDDIIVGSEPNEMKVEYLEDDVEEDTKARLFWAKEKLNEGIPCHNIEQSSDDSRDGRGEARSMLKIERVADGSQIETDDYFAKILTTTYTKNYDEQLICQLCSEPLISHQNVLNHIEENHRDQDSLMCIFDEKCKRFEKCSELEAHITDEHFNLLPTKLSLTCQTCETAFNTSIDFIKHMCITPGPSDATECPSCHKNLNSKKRCQFHQQFHLPNARPMICIICELRFSREEWFYNHVMFSHERIFEYFCELCDRSFSTQVLLSRHAKLHGDPTPAAKPGKSAGEPNRADLTCRICDKTFKRVSRYHKHLTRHEQITSNDVLTCERCALIFPNEDKANAHSAEAHPDEADAIGSRTLEYALCCEFCESAFHDPDILIDHKRSHQGEEKPFECQFCGNKYDAFSKLKTHSNSHAKLVVPFPVQRNYLCDIVNCLKRYRHWSDLQCHQKTVHLINPTIYKCPECEATFYNSWQFDYHKKSVHSGPSKCKLCDRMFQTLMQLKTHTTRAHKRPASGPSVGGSKRKSKRSTVDISEHIRSEDDKLFCRDCGKFLPSRNNARSHIEMVHLKIKNFDCSVCGKAFYLRKDFEDHERLHTADTPFHCLQCDKKFRTSSLLTEHRKSHSNERPYKCSYCDSAFKRAYVLKLHIKQHLGEKGFSCQHPNCVKEFRTNWELNMHNRKKHAEIEESVAAESESEQCVEASGHDQEKRRAEVSKQPTKRSAVASSSSKQTKIIYVMPGPAQEFEAIDFANVETYDQNTPELGRNGSSKDSKYVFFVETTEELETQFVLNS